MIVLVYDDANDFYGYFEEDDSTTLAELSSVELVNPPKGNYSYEIGVPIEVDKNNKQ